MTATNLIFPKILRNRVGTPGCPVRIDIRTDRDFSAYPRLIPSAIHRFLAISESWMIRLADNEVMN